MAFVKAVLVLLVLASIHGQPCVAIPLGKVLPGVCFGRKGDNLPPASQVVALYQKYGIQNMRIFQPDMDVLTALKGTKIQVSVGVLDQDLPNLAASVAAAQQWYDTNVKPFPDVDIIYITVGNEVIPGDLGKYVAPAMHNFQKVISGTGRDIGITTSVFMTILGVSFPPSKGTLASSAVGEMTDVLKFLQSNKYPLLINAYPYYAYTADTKTVRLDYALFTAPGPVVHDQGHDYSNLLHAMVDAVLAAAEKVNAPVDILVSESGWPSAGNGNLTTPALAGTYNRNLWKLYKKGSGTPRSPSSPLTGYIFAMFNEDLKSAGENDWGLFYPNGTAVYPFFDS